jgi:hypothetical protein
MKLKIKANKLTRTVEGVKKQGYYGRVITNGTKTFADIAKESARNTTLHPKEAELAANLLLDAITERIKDGFIIDLGPIGKLYPAVSSKWVEDAEDLSLSDMQPRVNYRPSDDIAGAVRGASLAWATEKDEQEGTATPEDDNQGGGSTPPQGGELEG